jgi:hypothetical protein
MSVQISLAYMSAPALQTVNRLLTLIAKLRSSKILLISLSRRNYIESLSTLSMALRLNETRR